MMLIGYARVSTQDQTLRLQHDALTDGGCEKLFREKLSGTSTTLPAREKLLAFARKGDVVVVLRHISTGQIRGTSPRVRRKRTMAQGDAWYNSDCYGWLIKWTITRNYSRR